ncbi:MULTISPECIES: hypothetical protein [Actinomycetes]|uniref:Sulfate permease n=1 Tax=Parenemella sanctibonifatiensis TaxID=2016505 RepID=A0A255DXM5_9ACTN|nr:MULTISPECIES: hypothetical protein [Actinomycetes]OYN84066.1 sulfate permease [Parenemella sanctibonifatiensis]
MIWLIFIAVVILFRVLRPWIPSTILLDWFRTQRDPKWGLWAMLAGVVYFGFAYGCTVLIDNGGPEWLHLFVLIGICEGFRFLFHGFGIYLRLRAARRKERRVARDADGQASSPGGYEALPGDEHGPTYLGRASGALQA